MFMKKEFDTIRFKKLARILEVIMSIFYWIFIASMAISVLIVPILLVVLQGDLTVGHIISLTGGFDLKLDAAYGIGISISSASLPAEANLTWIAVNIAAVLFCYCLALTVVFRQVIEILKTVASSTPFEEKNSKRLQRIGIVLIIASVLFNNLCSSIFMKVIDILKIQHVNISFGADTFMLLTGFLMLILSGVFRYGSYLQSEYDSTL